MEKVLVNLFVPAIGEYFDIFIPNFIDIATICELLGESVMELSNGEYITSGEEVLCSLEKRQIFSFECTLDECDVKNGETLILY